MSPSSAAESGSNATQAAILDAALAEFAARGFDGTRIETVARVSGRNKALIYRYFGDKAGLFHAALARAFGQRDDMRAGAPTDLSHALVHWFDGNAQAGDFMRLIMQEALTCAATELPEAEYRREFYGKQVEGLERMATEGQVDPELDPQMLFFAMLALTAFPWMVGNLTQLVTGSAADDPDFQRRWRRLLRQLARKLAPEIKK